MAKKSSQKVAAIMAVFEQHNLDTPEDVKAAKQEAKAAAEKFGGATDAAVNTHYYNYRKQHGISTSRRRKANDGEEDEGTFLQFGKFALRGTSSCWQVCVRSSDEESGVEVWAPRTYHSSLKGAVDALFSQRVRLSSATTLRDLIKRTEEIRQEFARLLAPLEDYE